MISMSSRTTLKTQAWFWTTEWQAGEREADADLAAGRVENFESDEAFVTALRSSARDPVQRREN
jgi:hypothetical protein